MQTAADKKTWKGNFDDCCILFWAKGQKSVPFSTTTNVPTFFTAPSLRTYQTFAATFEACEAPFFQRETVLQVPGHTLLMENAKITPEKFVAEDDFHHGNRKWLIDDKVNKDDETICTSNVPDPSDESIHHGPLIFDPPPPIAADEDIPLAAADDQSELMQWHYRLGHLPFQKLKQLALNGDIPKKNCQSSSPPSALAVYLAQ